MGGFGFDIGVEGEGSINGLFLALRNLPLHLTDEVHIAALKKAGKVLQSDIALNQWEDTGLLATDLRVSKTKFKVFGQHQVIVGYRKRRGGHGFLAHMLEYGTVKMAARPIMRRSDERTKSQQEFIYETEIQKEVDKRINGL